MNRRTRLCATAGLATVLSLGMLPATAWGSGDAGHGQVKSDNASTSPRWEAESLYTDGDDCDNAADEGVDNGSFKRAECSAVRKGHSEAYVLWVVYA
jgi:hypothetical protein